MTLTFASTMANTGIDPAETLLIRHAYVPLHLDGTPASTPTPPTRNSWPTPGSSRSARARSRRARRVGRVPA